MNIKDIIEYIQEVFNANKVVHQVTTGDVYEVWNNKDIKYGCVNIDLQSITQNGNQMSFAFYLVYGDRLLEDKSNEYLVQSDGLEVLRTGINYIKNNAEQIYVNNSTTIQYTPFVQKFGDYLGGAYCVVNLVVNANDCDFEESGTGTKKVLYIDENGNYSVRHYDFVEVNISGIDAYMKDDFLYLDRIIIDDNDNIILEER